MNCILPLLLLILAPSPCDTLRQFNDGLWKANEMHRFERWTRDLPQRDAALVDLLPLTVIEEPDAFPCSVGFCYGSLTISAFGYVLHYSAQHAAAFGTMAHELSHALYARLHDLEEGLVVGHGGATDPHFIALDSWRRWMYACDQRHPYCPLFEPAALLALQLLDGERVICALEAR